GKLAYVEDLEPFVNHPSQMAALDYIVSVESDVFIPSYSGNMARAIEGHLMLRLPCLSNAFLFLGHGRMRFSELSKITEINTRL
ncbi:hypothetical protein CUMW_203630, partial [Citrus unshiu]